jgi:hypothetical protein
MKKIVALVSFAIALLGAAPPPSPAERAEELATDRRVHGVITSVETATVTIASAQRAVTGRIDPARTKVTIGGKAARVSDLKVTAHAKAELCLDDVWLTIDAH